MMFALGAASSLLDSLQALTANSSSSSASTGQSQAAANPFDLVANTQASGTATTAFSPQTSNFSAISPQTMSALLDAQSKSGATSSAPTNPSDSLQDLYSQIDGNGDGSITKSEFENALGAGGTNTAAADKVFGELDANGDGSVSLDEMKSALQGAGHHGHHHTHASGSSDSSSTDGSTDPNTDPLLQALEAASSTSGTSTTGNGYPVSSLTEIDKSKLSIVSLNGSGSASSSYNMIQQAMARAEQAFSNSIAGSLSVSA
jgi:EF-hand domain pair